MNRKIPFHELATLLAGNCNITPTEAEDFIKSFFEQLTQSLVNGETVKIKGVGIFAPTGDASDPVSFTPDAEIADSINAPFAMFEPEEVSEALTDEAFDELDAPVAEQEAATTEQEQEQESTPAQVQEPKQEPTTEPEQAPVTEPMPKQEPTPEPEPEQAPEPEPKPVPVPEPVAPHVTEPAPALEPQPIPVTPTQADSPAPSDDIDNSEPSDCTKPTDDIKPTMTLSEEEPEEYFQEPARKSGAGFGWGFVIGMLVGLAIGACGVFFAIDYIFPTMPEAVNNVSEEEELINNLDSIAAPLQEDTTAAPTATVAATDSVKATVPDSTPAPAAVPAPAPTIVKDTVRPGYLLNDMAKKHYGNKCFWVYIYEENKAKIANPNRVGPGLVLVIPPAEKYGIDSSSQTSIKAANEKAGKILAKYPK